VGIIANTNFISIVKCQIQSPFWSSEPAWQDPVLKHQKKKKKESKTNSLPSPESLSPKISFGMYENIQSYIEMDDLLYDINPKMLSVFVFRNSLEIYCVLNFVI
jgi:hypothetical protein